MRMCGILKIALREDDPGTHVLKVAAEDVAGVLVQGKPIEPGQYSCSRDAWERFAPAVLARLQKTPKIDHNGHPVVDADGQPVMTLPPGATLDNIDPRILM